MEKEFITYKQALALKELGFDEPCLAGYQLQKATLFSDIPHTLNGNIHKNSEGSFTCAPLYQQAFRWFREKHKLHSYIEGAYPWFRYYINSEDDRFEGHRHLLIEESEQACLDNLIEIVKNK